MAVMLGESVGNFPGKEPLRRFEFHVCECLNSDLSTLTEQFPDGKSATVSSGTTQLRFLGKLRPDNGA